MSEVVAHEPCPECGSRDNVALYSDGHRHCFGAGCGYHTPPDQEGAPEQGEAPPRGAGPRPHTVRAIRGRNLTEETCRRYGYGVGSGYHVAPYRDSLGRPVAWKYRDRAKDFWWEGDIAAALPLFGQHLQEGGKRVFVTEGELDALALSQALGNRWPVVSVPNGAPTAADALKRAEAWLDTFDAITLVLDMDEAGRRAVEEAAPILPPGKVYVAALPPGVKDAGDLVKAGREDELKAAVWNAPKWAPSWALTGDDLWRAVRGRWSPPFARWEGFPALDDMTRGLRRHEIVLVAAAPSAGKSTFCRTVAFRLIKAGVRVGVVSLEETLDQFMLPLVGYAVGENARTQDEDPTAREEYRRAFDELAPHLVGYDDDGDRSPDTIFDRIRYMRSAEACDVVILDHVTILMSSSDDRDSVRFADRLMARLEALVKRTGVCVIVVAHLRKGDQGRSFTTGHTPTLDDVRGSGNFVNNAHTVLALVRDQSANEGGRVDVLKCRNAGTGLLGPADDLLYDQGTGLLVSRADPEEALKQY